MRPRSFFIVIAALIAGRTLLDRSGDSESVQQNNQRAAVSLPAVQPPVNAGPAAPVRPAAIQPARTGARQFSRRLADAITPPAEEESLIPPLAIAPLTTTQIAVDTSSGVTPIEIEPLQIEPLLGQ